MTTMEFCESFVHLRRGQLINFDQRPYLEAIYKCSRNLVLRCSRQVEKSTLLANTIIYEACVHPGIQILFVSPRHNQAEAFSKKRIRPIIEHSPIIARRLFNKSGRLPVKDIEFSNGSTLFIRSAYLTADSCRGISADLLAVDEFQDIAAGDLPVLQETLSHAPNGRTILTGTPKHIDNHLERMFRRSTANEWTVCCDACHAGVTFDERSIGASGPICSRCGAPIDPAKGRWIPRNEGATWGEGYCINHIMVPWMSYDKILERHREYDIPTFKNEVLGLPTTTGDCVVTRAELEACCQPVSMAKTISDIPPEYRDGLVAGIDWGGGGVSRTVIVIGYMSRDNRFTLCRFERFAATEDPGFIIEAVAECCRRFRVRWLAVDGGGNGSVYNRLLYNQIGRQIAGVYAIYYSSTDHEPERDGVLMRWTVSRTRSIGAVVSRIKARLMRFPRAEECGSYLDEFACEIAEYDDIVRTVKYTHPEDQADDALHATNYALIIAVHREYARTRQAW